MEARNRFADDRIDYTDRITSSILNIGPSAKQLSGVGSSCVSTPYTQPATLEKVAAL